MNKKISTGIRSLFIIIIAILLLSILGYSSITKFVFNKFLFTTYNIVGIIIAPILHCYFDVFSGCIQMYIFVSLTMAFVNSELGD